MEDPLVLENIKKLTYKDLAHTKIFVHSLGWTLKLVFSKYGELEDCTIIMDKGFGKSKGYGFITFKNMDGTRRALKELSKKINNRMTTCQMVSMGHVPSHQVNELMGWKIYVINVLSDVSVEKLLSFSKYGEVEEGPLGFNK
eukprot:Gb_41330 [translate_table: standard]